MDFGGGWEAGQDTQQFAGRRVGKCCCSDEEREME